MKSLAFCFLFSFAPCFGSMSTAGQESEHFEAEFWQRSDGYYCLKIKEFPENEDHLNHCYFVERLIPVDDCACYFLDND